VAVEAGVSGPWFRYVGLAGRVLGLDRFGESAPAETLFDHFGFSGTRVAAEVEALLAGRRQASVD